MTNHVHKIHSHQKKRFFRISLLIMLFIVGITPHRNSAIMPPTSDLGLSPEIPSDINYIKMIQSLSLPPMSSNNIGNTSDYSTFLGGSDRDYAYSMVVDDIGNVYLTGNTFSSDFPTTPGAYNETLSGDDDIFVCKISPDGSKLIYSTFIGGSSQDSGRSMAIDDAGNVFLTGRTNSSDFPTTPGAYNETLSGEYDIYVCKLNPDGSDLIYSTFIGGSDFEASGDLIIDDSGNAYLTGKTNSDDFPTTNGAHNRILKGDSDAFVCKLNSDGSDLIFSTFLGGMEHEYGFGIALDDLYNVYISGFTGSSDFPTTEGCFDPIYKGNNDLFACKLNFDGTALIYSTFIGGADQEINQGGLAIDSFGNTYIAGYTTSNNFPVTDGVYHNINENSQDIFICKLNANGTKLVYSTTFGGSSGDWLTDFALDDSENVYLTGFTGSSDFPTTENALESTYHSSFDIFVCCLSSDGSILMYSTLIGGSEIDASECIALDNSGNLFLAGDTASFDFPTTDGAFNRSYSGNRDIFIFKFTMPPYIPKSYTTVIIILSFCGITAAIGILFYLKKKGS